MDPSPGAGVEDMQAPGGGMQEARRDAALLRLGVASVWLATGLLVLTPQYREVGSRYLGALGLPDALMWATCAGEVALGLWVALRTSDRWSAGLQVALVTIFTLILAFHEPMLLVSPYGVLTKNLPIVGSVLVALWLEGEGWSPRARWTLRLTMAAIWATEGLGPKILFQQAEELTIAARTGLSFGHPERLLAAIGAAQITGGLLALTLRGRPLRLVLGAQVLALIALPLVVGWMRPDLWFHPFGPLTKTIPVLAGTFVLWRRCSTWS